MGPSRRASRLTLALAALTVLGAMPLAAQQPAAQQTAGSTPAAADAELTSFAKAFVAVGLVRDDFNGQLALAKNKTVEHQTEIRLQMKAKVEEAIRSAGLTPDAYRRIEYSITVEPARRAAFDQVMVELARAG